MKHIPCQARELGVIHSQESNQEARVSRPSCCRVPKPGTAHCVCLLKELERMTNGLEVVTDVIYMDKWRYRWIKPRHQSSLARQVDTVRRAVDRSPRRCEFKSRSSQFLHLTWAVKKIMLEFFLHVSVRMVP